MPFPEPQCQAVFLARPQRFLAHMAFADGSKETVYCANPGSFKGCLQSGSDALLWDSEDSRRKRRYTWRAIRLGRIWVGTDTHLANRLVEELLRQGLLPCLSGYAVVRREQRLARGARADFLLQRADEFCFLEVKSATVVEKGVARFPDSVTPRGVKQLKELTRKAREGHRAVLLFVVQRDDAKEFSISGHYPAYSNALKKALARGVEVFACALKVSPRGFGEPRLLSLSTRLIAL
jgi:sugar fermentation stimulation protein A